jgi:hypothetical protein
MKVTQKDKQPGVPETFSEVRKLKMKFLLTYRLRNINLQQRVPTFLSLRTA